MKAYYKFLLLLLIACSACNKSSEQEAEPMREAIVTDAFAVNFADDLEERNRWAVETRTATVDGELPEEMLCLEVQIPGGQKKSAHVSTPITIRLPDEQDEQSVAKLTIKWKAKLQADEADENDEPPAGTRLVLEQQLQIAIGGTKIPATMKKIHELDKQHQTQLRKAIDRKANFKQQLNGINQEMNRIRDSALPPQKKNAYLTRLVNQRNTILNRLKIADIEFRKYKRFLEGAAQFGANVLRPLKGNAINYRVYLQRKDDEKQIDLMRSSGFSNAIVDQGIPAMEGASESSTEEAENNGE